MVTGDMDGTFSLAAVPDWLITTIIGLVGFGVYYVWKASQGLGEAQVARDTAQDHATQAADMVIQLQEKRIALLEKEVQVLNAQVLQLTAENERQRTRILRLEKLRQEVNEDGTI